MNCSAVKQGVSPIEVKELEKVEETTNVNISGVKISVVEEIRALGGKFSPKAAYLLELGLSVYKQETSKKGA